MHLSRRAVRKRGSRENGGGDVSSGPRPPKTPRGVVPDGGEVVKTGLLLDPALHAVLPNASGRVLLLTKRSQGARGPGTARRVESCATKSPEGQETGGVSGRLTWILGERAEHSGRGSGFCSRMRAGLGCGEAPDQASAHTDTLRCGDLCRVHRRVENGDD